MARFDQSRHNRRSVVRWWQVPESAQRLLQSLHGERGGLSLAEILARHPDVTRRTAQRWLAQLAEDGLITAVGAGRARRYLLAEQSEIPLATASREILGYVEQPIAARKPVGYQQELLLDYRPNETWYLPRPLRERLRRMGELPPEQRRLAAGTYGRALVSRLLIDLSWASSRLEGNTYSWLDTRRLIEESREATGRAAIETQMILNHRVAIELLVDNVDAIRFNRFTLLNLHSLLAENLLPNPNDEGRLREHLVEIGGSVYYPLAVPAQIEHMFDMLLEKAEGIEDPFEQSFFALVHLPYLQPFADVNKRTSRLAANMPLIRASLCPLTFLGVPQQMYVQALLGVYEMMRIELLRDLYVWAYERSTREYIAIRQDLAEPSRLRLTYREVIKQAVYDTVMRPSPDPTVSAAVIEQAVATDDREDVRFLIADELQRLHEGVLARYGIRLDAFRRWRDSNSPKGQHL